MIIVNRLTARKLFKQWKINWLSNSRDREPSRINSWWWMFFPRCMVILGFIRILEPPGVLPEKLVGVCSSTLSRLLTDFWSSVNRVSNEYQLGCQLSVNQDFDRVSITGWLRVLMDTQPQMHLVHTIYFLSVYSVSSLWRKPKTNFNC